MLGQAIMSLSVLAGSILMYYQATQLQQIESYQNVGSDFWPKLILIVLIAISGYIGFSNLKLYFRSREVQAEDAETGEGWLRVAIAVSIIIGYILLLKPIGFIVASPLLIAAMMYAIRPDRKKAIPVGIVGIMLLIYVLFCRLLMIPLPKGHGFFRDISIFLGL